jgi:hypothetical protein
MFHSNMNHVDIFFLLIPLIYVHYIYYNYQNKWLKKKNPIFTRMKLKFIIKVKVDGLFFLNHFDEIILVPMI